MNTRARFGVISLIVAAVGISGSAGQVSGQAAVATGASGATGPRESASIPLPVVETGRAARPGVGELPVREGMPEVLRFETGAVVTRDTWDRRRTEMREILEYYAVGYAPEPPGNVRAREVVAAVVNGGKVKYRLIRLTFGPGEKLELNVGVYTPVAAEGRRVPAVVEIGWNTPPGATVLPRQPAGPTQGRGTDPLLLVGGGVPASQPAGTGALGVKEGETVPMDVAERFAATSPVLAAGFAFATFHYNDAGEDTTLRNPDGGWAYRTTRFFPAYPRHDWGLVRAWAWGASRIADYLETDPAIDATKLMVTGFSRCGKAALVAGALDDRFALTAPAASSGAGTPAFRFSGADRGGNEGLTEMVRKYPNWFGPNLRQFMGLPEKLPFDQHWWVAMCAPRAFLALEGLGDRNVNKAGVRKTFEAARPAYDMLGETGKLGVNWVDRPHAMQPADWEALAAFAEKAVLGKREGRGFDAWPPETEGGAQR